jgi:hypothetical protein
MGGVEGGGALSLGTLKDGRGRLWEQSDSLYAALQGKSGGCSHSEDSERHVLEGSRNRTFLLQRLHKGNLQVFSKGGLSQYVYWARTCTIYISVLCISWSVCGLILGHNILGKHLYF